MTKDHPLVCTTRQIEAPLLSALASREILAMRIPGFCEEAVCSHAMKNLVAIQGEGYKVNPNFRKIVGGALFDGAGDPRALDSCLRQAPGWYREYRRIFSPYMAPADKLRLQLEETWPAGSSVERVKGHLAFAGILRGIGEGPAVEPHQDTTNWDLPDSPEAESLATQLSCVVYLCCATEGGELELWNSEITDRGEYESRLRPMPYGLDRSQLSEPDAVLEPKVGELIIFNARRIHAVRGIRKGMRYSQSLFIGFRGENSRITLFS